YYMNAELTSLRNVCRFRREFVPVVKAGRHEFFREATREERKELANAEFDACTRYTALLEAQRAKAKRVAAKKGKGKHKVGPEAGNAKGKHQAARPSNKNTPARPRLPRR